MILLAPRYTGLQYTGSNGAAILAMFADPVHLTAIGDYQWSIGSESGGVLTIVCSDPNQWAIPPISTNDYLIFAPGPRVLTPAELAQDWVQVGTE